MLISIVKQQFEMDDVRDDFESEGVNLLGLTIRELVGDLDKSLGNSKEWMLQLHDGRQLVITLSLYRSLDCMLVSSSLEVSVYQVMCLLLMQDRELVGQMGMWS